jgi:hypothetical protein
MDGFGSGLMRRGWVKGFDFDIGGGGLRGEGLHPTPIFTIRETMTIAYIR